MTVQHAVPRSFLFGVLLSAAIAAPVMPTAFAAEEKIKAFSVWVGSGPVIKTGENRATFSGAFTGTVYVETERGPVPAGLMMCPAMLEIDLTSGKQQATAHCQFLAQDGSSIFADLSCSGIHLVGCNGAMEITGGTGRFAGVTGGGKSIIRGDFREIRVEPGQPVTETVTGILYWPELTYSLP
jgi:hypothetical protein